MSAAERLRIRALRSKPLLDELQIWLDQHIPIVPPRSALGKAMNYAHKQWPKLTVFIEDGRLRMDNNLVENAIRPFVIGKKNFLFCDTVNGVEPYAYLRTVFIELPNATSVEAIEALLPVPAADENLANVS